mgnify:CR=1 FL=1
MTTDALSALASALGLQEPRKKTSLVLVRIPSDPGYDPRTDAPAVRLYGAVYIDHGRWAGRYEYGVHIVDAWMRLVDTGACSACSGNRRVRVASSKPSAHDWEHDLVSCPQCSGGSE